MIQTARLERYAPLSGVASILFLIAGSGLLGVYDHLPSAESLLDVFIGIAIRVILAGYLGLIARAFLMWFVGDLMSFFTLRSSR